jgi:hypothetical protein
MSYDDEELNDFLHALDDSDIEASPFEAKFIESNLDIYIFTDRQREVIDEMIRKYGKRIGWL